MSKFSFLLKLCIIAFALSFATSCKDDEDTAVDPNGSNQQKDDTKNIVAYEREVSGQVKILKNKYESPRSFNGWNFGESQIIVEISNEDETILVGEGVIEPSGNFSITLDNSLSTEFMINPKDFANELDDGNFNKTEFSPNDLLLSKPAKIYTFVGSEKKEIFCRTSEYYTDSLDYSTWVDIDYNWNFYSKIGNTEVLAYTYYGPRYPVKIQNVLGWNRISYRIKPVTVRNIEILPEEAVYYIEE